jgi:hypothetical protein
MTLSPKDFDNMYRDEKGNIPNFFYIVKKDLGILENPKADKLMSIAWEQGHAYGYYEVYTHARELVELIK